MVATTIVIQSLEDAANGKPIVEGIIPSECQKFTVGILEKGTQGGQTSLMFVCQTGDKTAVCGQMTASQFEMLIGAFRGAIQRFGK